MDITFPKFILMKPYDSSPRGFYATRSDFDVTSIVLDSEGGAFNPLAKIEVVASAKEKDHVHLRFCRLNRYMGVSAGRSGILVAESKCPIEDKADSSCTLFHVAGLAPDDAALAPDDAASFYLTHVRSGCQVISDQRTSLVFLNSNLPFASADRLSFVDWETLVKLPDHVAFKGDNGKYLQRLSSNIMQFSSDDPNHPDSSFWIKPRPDGYVRIMDHAGSFWRTGDDEFIVPDNDKSDDLSNDGAFWAVKIDDFTIALRSYKNNKFCKRFTDKGDHGWGAMGTTMDMFTRVQVEALLLHRKILDITYMMDNAELLEQKPYLAGKTTVVNRGDTDDSIAVEITHQEETSSTFSHEYSVTVGVSTTFKTGVPFIAQGEISASLEGTAMFHWDDTTTKTTSVKATDTVPVPARSRVEVHYVGTRGTCSVPFSYIQQDTSSTDGKPRRTKRVDGIYTGVNCYDFRFEVMKSEPLRDNEVVLAPSSKRIKM